VQVKKLKASFIHEFFVFLKENHNIVECAEFIEILERLPVGEKAIWCEIVSVALGRSEKLSDFSDTLSRIRDNIGFHYYQSGKVLKKSFNSRFFGEERVNQKSRTAYYSVGNTLGETRFYFADAAVEEYLFLQAGKPVSKSSLENDLIKKYEIKVRDTIEVMNRILMLLLKNFLSIRRHNP
ncbi:MAG: hypothetical protein AAB965_01135, partial [Patescibacteria group bacterium]